MALALRDDDARGLSVLLRLGERPRERARVRMPEELALREARIVLDLPETRGEPRAPRLELARDVLDQVFDEVFHVFLELAPLAGGQPDQDRLVRVGEVVDVALVVGLGLLGLELLALGGVVLRKAGDARLLGREDLALVGDGLDHLLGGNPAHFLAPVAMRCATSARNPRAAASSASAVTASCSSMSIT